MFNGHMDTSYSGREPWLEHVPGFQPQAFVRDGRLYGLGISNMKGALACYVEAVRALRDAGVRLRGDVMIAAVCGEIEKTQQGDAVRAPSTAATRPGRATSSRTAASRTCASSASRPRARSCSATSARSGCASRRTGNFIHTAFSRGPARPELDPAHARGARRGARVDPDLGGRPGERVPRREGDRQRRRGRRAASAGACRGRRIAPTCSSTCACRRRSRWRVARQQVLDMVRGLAERFPDYGVEGEVYVTAPGAEIDEGHELVRRSTRRTRRSSARRPSATSRAGSPTRPR